jgi:hypothetical protein
MSPNKKPPFMNQMIFDLDLPVETISVYLLCCSLADSEQAITTKNIQKIWNGSADALTAGIDDLEKINILVKIISDRKDNNVYQLENVENWKI